MNFDFEGQQIAAMPGDSIASALYRHGLREFGVSLNTDGRAVFSASRETARFARCR